MVLLDKITIKTVKSLPFFPHYGKLPYFFFKLPHFMFSDKCIKYSLPPKNIRTIDQKRVIFYNFWNRGSHRNDCFLFLELFSIISQAHYVRSSVKNVLFRTYLFQNSLWTHPPLDFCTVIVHEIILSKSIGPTKSISDKKA